jgi:hypothetical protein
MTDEKFERACEIKASIDTIVELQNLLANSKGNGFGQKYLASIDVEKFDGSGYVIEECNVLNHIQVPVFIMEKFESILWDEYHKLHQEFEEL